MGGYGNCRKISGVFPVDEHYRDGAVMDLESGKWREIGNMWEEGERRRLGTVVVVDGVNGEAPGIFMLDRDEIFRYFSSVFLFLISVRINLLTMIVIFHYL